MFLKLHLNFVFDLILYTEVNFDFYYDIDLDIYRCLDPDCSLDLNIKFNL